MENLELKIIMAAVTALGTSIGTLGLVIRWMMKLKKNGGHTPPCEALNEMRRELLEDIRRLFHRDDETAETIANLKTDVEVIKETGKHHAKGLKSLDDKVDKVLDALLANRGDTNPGVG